MKNLGLFPIGIMESWNGGMMGLKEYHQIKNDLFRFLFPMFHYSNIPLR